MDLRTGNKLFESVLEFKSLGTAVTRMKFSMKLSKE
jgi:hypothetical protein